MLISNPLLPPNENFPEDLLVQGLDTLSGVYPVGPGQLWHGGIHVCCGATQPHSVYAIADGVVVGYRQSTVVPKDAKQLDDHPLNYMGWTHDGFVLLKHEKESGEGVPVVFYSLYMHLSELNKDLFKGAPGEVTASGKIKVSRKECLGKLGRVYGKADSMHFEIFTGKADLEKFFRQKKSGDDKNLWGDVYFILPPNTSYTLEEPTPDHPSPATPHNIGERELMISLSYGTSSKDNKPGSRILKTYRRTGEQIDTLEEAGAEYELYKRAQKWFPRNTSAGYELLRYGRVFGPDPLPAGAKNWQRVPLGYGITGWVDLNAPSIRKLSDADFPDWQWRLVREDARLFNINDGKCDAPEVLTLIDANNDGLLAPLEVAAAMQDPAIQKQMRYAVCLFPSEWDAGDDATMQRKWGWLKEYFKNPASRHKELAEKQKQWVQTVKTKAEARLAALHKELDGTRAAQKQMQARKEGCAKQRDEAAKALKEAQQQQKNKLAAVSTLRKHKHPTPEDIAKAEEQAQQAQQKTDEAKEVLARQEQALQVETANVAKADEGIKSLEREKESAEGIVKNAAKSLEAADKAIAAATEALKQPPKDPEQAWAKFKKHVMALSWWDALKGSLGDAAVWHFHPVAFIEHFRKCHWLSKEELKLAYKDSPEDVLEKYRVVLNKITYKYGINTPIRLTHFLGQGAQESGAIDPDKNPPVIRGLTTMVEPSNQPFYKESIAPETNGYYYNPQDVYYTQVVKYDNRNGNVENEELWHVNGTRITTVPGVGKEKSQWAKQNIDLARSKAGDGQKFRGRGMKQLTGRTNYSHYWAYRGWLIPKGNPITDPYIDTKNTDFDWEWGNGKTKRPAKIDNPQIASTVLYNCIDTGGWYWMANNINKAITSEKIDDTTISSVTKAINGAAKEEAPSYNKRRKAATKYIHQKFGDDIPSKS